MLKELKQTFLYACLATATATAQSFADEGATIQKPRTPIDNVVVIVLQDESFDRYFGIYPHALNLKGKPGFYAAKNTPSVDGFSQQLLSHNPNIVNPYRMAPDEPTCNLGYGSIAQRRSYNNGLMNMFVWKDNEAGMINDDGCFPSSVMGYYDGNTLQVLWNTAQHYAMSDHFFANNYSVSTTGLINIIAGDSRGVFPEKSPGVSYQDYLLGDNPPLFDDASKGKNKVFFKKPTIANVLNKAHISWGWFQGGFAPSSRNAKGLPVMSGYHYNSGGSCIPDYAANLSPFQYFKYSANPKHLPPASLVSVGKQDQANHLYDLAWFWKSLVHHTLPQVSFLMPAQAQDGEVELSTPISENAFLQKTINRLKASPEYRHMAIMIEWTDSDGWYDHVMPPNSSHKGRETYGPRLPFLVISPWAKHNYVSHLQVNQASVLKFIEYNWHLPYISPISVDHYANNLLDMFTFEPPVRD